MTKRTGPRAPGDVACPWSSFTLGAGALARAGPDLSTLPEGGLQGLPTAGRGAETKLLALIEDPRRGTDQVRVARRKVGRMEVDPLPLHPGGPYPVELRHSSLHPGRATDGAYQPWMCLWGVADPASLVPSPEG